jgi:hypothetical protein
VEFLEEGGREGTRTLSPLTLVRPCTGRGKAGSGCPLLPAMCGEGGHLHWRSSLGTGLPEPSGWHWGPPQRSLHRRSTAGINQPLSQ